MSGRGQRNVSAVYRKGTGGKSPVWGLPRESRRAVGWKDEAGHGEAPLAGMGTGRLIPGGPASPPP